MKIRLEIETDDRSLAFDIAGVHGELSTSNTIDVPGPATVRFDGGLLRKSVGSPEVVFFVLDLAKDVAVGLVSAWLYDKVKDKRISRLRIRRTEITRLTREGIEHAISEELDEDSL